ncbi:hypothetical protein JXA80_06885, partial [bacterium]|nr:hypothetical protein [candidate division CSSED10-310 bacterium]
MGNRNRINHVGAMLAGLFFLVSTASAAPGVPGVPAPTVAPAGPNDPAAFATDDLAVVGVAAVTRGDSAVAVSNNGTVSVSVGNGTRTITIEKESDLSDFTMFGSIRVEPDEVKNGDLVVFGGKATVDGRVTGSMVVFGGIADVSGHVDGDLVLMGGTVNLASTAEVDGSLVTIGGVVNRQPGAVIRDDTAIIGGQSMGLEDINVHHPDFGALKTSYRISLLLTWLVLAFVITLVFSRPLENTVDIVIRKPLQSLLAGFFFHVITLFACLILTVIIVGIPLAMLGGIIWMVIGIFGTTVGFALMGKMLLEKMGKGQVSILVMVVLGFGILVLIRFVPMFIGWTLWQLWGMAGIGATVMSRFGSNKP